MVLARVERAVRWRPGLWRDRLVWLDLFEDDRLYRRLLVDAETGEVLDDVWRDASGRVRSWTKGRDDPPAAGDRACSSASRSIVGGEGNSQDPAARLGSGSTPFAKLGVPPIRAA